MHRIDTPTAQIDKFGQGKNGFTNGDPSTGRRATDLNSDMWDAVQEEMANAIELTGIPLDKSKHNQLYLAIQKAITDKGYLRKDNNLLDLENTTDARYNLGLGSAATKDVGTDAAGQVLTVGSYGLSNTLKALNSTDLNTIQTFGFYVVQSPANGPAGSNGGTLFLNVVTWQSGTGTAGYRVIQEVIGYGQSGSTGNRVWRRTWTGSVWSGWIEFYSEARKPSATDTGALPITGGTLTGQLGINNADFINKNGYTTYNDGDGSLHRQAGGLRLTIADTILTEFYYNETAGKSAEVSLHNKYGSTDSYFSLRNDGRLSISGVSPQLNFSNGTVFAIDGNINGSCWGGYLSTWIDNQLTTRDNNIANRVDWGTFNREVGARATIDWVNANFVNRMQRGAQGSMTMDGGLVEAPAGCVLTGGNGNEGNQVGLALYRPLQILRGGSWVTIEG